MDNIPIQIRAHDEEARELMDKASGKLLRWILAGAAVITLFALLS